MPSSTNRRRHRRSTPARRAFDRAPVRRRRTARQEPGLAVDHCAVAHARHQRGRARVAQVLRGTPRPRAAPRPGRPGWRNRSTSPTSASATSGITRSPCEHVIGSVLSATSRTVIVRSSRAMRAQAVKHLVRPCEVELFDPVPDARFAILNRPCTKACLERRMTLRHLSLVFGHAHVVAAVVDQGALTFDFAIPCEVFGLDRSDIVDPGTSSSSSPPATAASARRPAS